MSATFVNLYDGRPTEVEVSGKYTSRDATIKLSTGQLLGRIMRCGPDEYAVEVRHLFIHIITPSPFIVLTSDIFFRL